jgi:hypothetical protein
MTPKRHRVRVMFALFAVLAILSLFVLHGPLSGVAGLAAMLVFIAACIAALRGEDPEAVANGERTGLSGWFGGWL